MKNLENALKKVEAVETTYPELDKVAKEIVDATIKMINDKTKKVTSDMPYKAQYVLEELIKLLEAKV